MNNPLDDTLVNHNKNYKRITQERKPTVYKPKYKNVTPLPFFPGKVMEMFYQWFDIVKGHDPQIYQDVDWNWEQEISNFINYVLTR